MIRFLISCCTTWGRSGTASEKTATPVLRTAPLWGIRFIDQTKLLHDGRGTSLTNAILRHDGQASNARLLFNLLTPNQKAAVIAFLNAL